ncbi:alpha/beta fold hydrolase [Nocardiopsis sp. NPDC006832]|uniref:thioesterase II family protein n=1 Tax=Nocardiopsis sp. NPDC006832 TaxID=3157188 RepID=UPI0033C952BC
MTMPSSAPTAVFVPRPVPDPELRLFLMHHAGGSHLLYREWLPHLPDDWEVCLLEAPGRGRLAGRSALTEVRELVDHVRSAIVPLMDRPTAFFGHSMGALVIHELVRTLALRGDPLPFWAGLSAWCADVAEERIPAHTLPTSELRSRVAELGGTPRELLEDIRLWELYEPVIRADFQLVDTWAPDGGTPWPAGVTVSVFGGSEDAVAEPGVLREWSHREFPGGPEPRVFQGGHFYFQGRVGEVVDHLVGDVRAVLTTKAP